MKYPEGYEWLGKVGQLPRIVTEALKLVGVKEFTGEADNPVIIKWAKEVGRELEKVYGRDAIPWCGLFMAVVAKRAGKAVVDGPLWALNWKKFGVAAKSPKEPSLGDVLTFKRDGGGHVGIYIAEDHKAYHVLGGNQKDQVCIVPILKDRLHSWRRPVYSVAQPASVKPYIVSRTGELSTNEA
jgi:uncharacterized protein (TIGR02594 family)